MGNSAIRIHKGQKNFTDLYDVPDSYAGQSGKVPAVKGTEDGLEFVEPSGSGSTPTGTGFRHISSGAEDAASKLVEDEDVDDDAAIAVSKLAVGAAGQVLEMVGTVPAWGRKITVSDSAPTGTPADGDLHFEY